MIEVEIGVTPSQMADTVQPVLLKEFQRANEARQDDCADKAPSRNQGTDQFENARKRGLMISLRILRISLLPNGGLLHHLRFLLRTSLHE